MEITWTIIPAIIGLWLFAWGAQAYVRMTRIPRNALEVYVVGKQWMWKLQHAEGPRDINELHVPVGRPVKLLMTSQDVIHSFFVPAFRTKRDVLPGRSEAQWFEATTPGEFYIFCAEYCGTEHSRMRGRIVAMAPDDYAKWIEQNRPAQSTVATGQKLFQQFACDSCHSAENSERGPALVGIFGKEIQLRSGLHCEADESYLARSIWDPHAEFVAGYDATMPSYKGQIDEEQVVALLAYIKSLGSTAAPAVIGRALAPNTSALESAESFEEVERKTGPQGRDPLRPGRARSPFQTDRSGVAGTTSALDLGKEKP